MWEINVGDQTLTFILSLCLGAVLCGVYDLLRAVRKAGVNSFFAVFLTDILFWIFSAFLTFIFFMSRTNGEIRGYVLFSELMGFALFRISLSRLIFPVMSFIFVKISKIIHAVNLKFNVFSVKFESIIIKSLKRVGIFLKKSGKKCKKLLKNGVKLLYTNEKAKAENILNETKTEA